MHPYNSSLCLPTRSVLRRNCFVLNLYSLKTVSSRMSWPYDRPGNSSSWACYGYLMPCLREQAKFYMEVHPVRRISCFLEYNQKALERVLYER